MKTIYMILLSLALFGHSIAQTGQRTVEGTILGNRDRLPIPGVNVIVKGSTNGTVTNENGDFLLTIPASETWLILSFIGYQSQEILVSENQTKIEAIMTESDIELQGVNVFSTGFQDLPLERSTGSFVGINQELVDRRISTNLIDRLEDITPGLIFNRDQPNLERGESISIRGTATLISNSEPLIVVDNLAYDGPLSSINPNDVASITVLKDAAAASIWGARAGNGVIVITTKKGRFEQPIKVSITSNFTGIEKPDPYYFPRMSINSLVDKQLELYANNYYRSQLNNVRNPVVNPLAEAKFAFDQGRISENELNQLIEGFRNSDVRNDIDRYLKRPATQQQYAVSLNGGSKIHNYQISAGWDTNHGSDIASQNSRITLSTQQTWRVAKERIEVGMGAYWVQSKTYDAMPTVANLFPYDRLADADGSPLPVFRDYSVRFKDQNRNLLAYDWDYVPLKEVGLSPNNSLANDLRIFSQIKINLFKGLDFSANYQYWNNYRKQSAFNPEDSYFTRDLINSFTQIDDAGNRVHYVPLGGILDQQFNSSFSHNLRSQLTYSSDWKGLHRINGFIGGELKDFQSENFSNRSYGYNNQNGTSLPVDYVTRRNNFATGLLRNIPFLESFGGSINRFVSLFANVGYSYKDRYLFNGSVRKDASNLFGVNTNQKSVPLWSAGIGWVASEEEFLKGKVFDFLKLRVSYGYNGNTNSNASAFTTASAFPGAQNLISRLPFLAINTPPNPELRWEKIKIINIGSDFELKGGRISGSLEYYDKKGLDLLGNIAMYPSSGFTQATLNYASTQTRGWDLVINTINTNGKFKWETAFFLSSLQEEVLEVENNPTATQLINYTPALPTPAVGRPLFSIFSFPFAGLNPTDGAPRGIVDGEPSTDYSRIYSDATPENIQFHGSGRPTHFGAVRNTLTYKGWSISANISYRMGYFFRRPSVNFDDINRGGFQHADYERRWRNPGDEQFTTIPSDPGRVDAFKTQFYLSSSATVEKGDHIRFQDVRLAYDFPVGKGKNVLFENLETYLYINNLGILWKASKKVKDPDYLINPSLRSLSLGLKARF